MEKFALKVNKANKNDVKANNYELSLGFGCKM